MINNTVLVGRLTKDPELKYMQASGTPVVNFTVAVNRDYKDSSGNIPVDFIGVQFMGKMAETIANHFTKGRTIAVIGSVRVNNYEDNSGNKRSYTFIAGKQFSFVSGDKKESGDNPTYDPSDVVDSIDFSAVNNDDVPF